MVCGSSCWSLHGLSELVIDLDSPPMRNHVENFYKAM